MKRLFTLVLIVFSFSAQAQWHDCLNFITFESTDVLYPITIVIDTHNYHNNIWQVGKPQKTVFDSAHFSTNAILTDTINTYPPNDTSVFVLKVPRILAINSRIFYEIAFNYQLDIDSTTIAMFEVSIDSGLHWINTADSLPTDYFWSGIPPDFSLSTDNWQQASLVTGWGSGSDTILFRFTFISDTVLSLKDGWMIDNISILYYCEGAASNIQNNNLISLYPNPSKGNIYIHSNASLSQKATVSIFNALGQEVYKAESVPPDGYLHLSLPDGIYTLKYFAGDEYCVKRLVIAN